MYRTAIAGALHAGTRKQRTQSEESNHPTQKKRRQPSVAQSSAHFNHLGLINHHYNRHDVQSVGTRRGPNSVWNNMKKESNIFSQASNSPGGELSRASIQQDHHMQSSFREQSIHFNHHLGIEDIARQLVEAGPLRARFSENNVGDILKSSFNRPSYLRGASGMGGVSHNPKKDSSSGAEGLAAVECFHGNQIDSSQFGESYQFEDGSDPMQSSGNNFSFQQKKQKPQPTSQFHKNAKQRLANADELSEHHSGYALHHRQLDLNNEENDLKSRVTKLLNNKEQQVIILKKSVVYLYHGDVKIYGLKSLYIFHGDNWFRKAAVWFVNWGPFDAFILIVIGLNSLALAMFDYSDRDSLTLRNQIIDIAGQAFTIIFTIESLLEIVARGLILHKRAYLRDGWCCVDFVVIVTGLMEFGKGSVKLKSLRVLRALRPLRSINAIPSMRKLVSALIQSMPDFVNVGIFLFFVFMLFSILGLHQYSGQFYNACRYNPVPETNTTWAIDESFQRMCSKTGYGNFICPPDRYCGNPEEFGIPLEGERAVLKPYMYYGLHSFDNIWSSLQIVFQIVTAEAWSTYMYNLMDLDSPIFAAFYTIFIVVIGSFFLMNLILAVIIQAFIAITKRELDQEVRKLDEEDEKRQAAATMQIIQHIEQEGDIVPELQRNDMSLHSPIKAPFNQKVETQPLQDGQVAKIAAEDYRRPLFVNKKASPPRSPSPSHKKEPMLNLEPIDEDISNLSNSQNYNKNPFGGLVLKKMSLEGAKLKKALSSDQQSSRQSKQKSQSITNERSIKYQDDSIDPDDNDIVIEPQYQTNKSLVERVQQFSSENLNYLIPEPRKESLLNLPRIIEVKDPQANSSRIVNCIIIHMTDQLSVHSRKPKIVIEKNPSVNEIVQVQSDTPNQDLSNDYPNSKSISETPFSSQEPFSTVFNRQLVPKTTNSAAIGPLKQNTFAEAIAELTVKKGKLSSPGNVSIKSEQQPIQEQLTAFDQAFQSYLIKKKIQLQRKKQFYNKLLSNSKATSYEETRNELQNQNTLRSIATLRIRIDIRRQENNLSKHYKKFQIEYRSEQSRLFAFAYRLSQNSLFQSFVTTIILVNTLILALDKYPDENSVGPTLEKMNITFSIFFCMEMVIKMVGMGFKGYFWDTYNIFDSVIVMTSLVDLLISNLLSRKTGSVITALRSFRLLRLFKLAKQWKRLHHLLKTIAKTLKDVGTFSILLSLFIYTFSLLGMELFGNRVKFAEDLSLDLLNGESPDSNFDTLTNAIATVFIVLTADGWSAIYFSHRRAVQNALPTGFFIILIIIGQRVLLNLFLAILLENFDENTLREELQKELQASLNLQEPPYGLIVSSFVNKTVSWLKKKFKCFSDIYHQQASHTVKTSVILDDSVIENLKSPENISKSNKSHQSVSTNVVEGKSLNLFPVDNKFRILMSQIVSSKKFEYLITLCIIVSAVQLALDGPLKDPKGTMITTLYYIDISTTSIFVLECILKIISYGFLTNGRSSYLKNPWNLIDFIIILLSSLSLAPFSNQLRIFKMFRILRVFRLIGKNESLQVGVKALLYAIPNMANVTIIILFFFLIFGILCVSYFKGKLFYCTDTYSALSILKPQLSQVDNLGQTTQSKWDCLDRGGEWINQPYTFDNVFSSMQTLFIMATGAAWSDQMYLMAAATEVDYEGEKLHSIFWIFFCIFYIIVASFFLLNLFVGVVISTFNSEQDRLGGKDLLTDKQKEWIESRLLILKTTPITKRKPPKNTIRKICFKIQDSKWFEMFILVSIILNTLVLTVRWYEQPVWLDTMTEYINFVFFAVFTIEAILKIIGLGFRTYFRDTWNTFDFGIIIVSAVSIVLYFTITMKIKNAVTMIRAFRILRVVRLIKRAKSLNLIFNTFIVSLPALSNIGGLLLILLYLYSILGVQMFGAVKRNGLLTDTLNFESFSNAFCVLCAIATADSWGTIVDSAQKAHSIKFNCFEEPTYEDYLNNDSQPIGCGPGWSGTLYFLSFYLFVNLIFLNLFIAIVLQGYQETQCKDQRLFNQDMLQRFREVWSEFDPEATSFIQISQLRLFLGALGGPLGFSDKESENKSLQDKFMSCLQLPTYDNFSHYHFIDVLDAISMRLMIIDHAERFKLRGKSIKKGKMVSDSLELSSEDELRMNTEEQMVEMKQLIQDDINKLMRQSSQEGISAVKEVRNIEQKAAPFIQLAKKDGILTSEHHAAAEVAALRMKRFVLMKKEVKDTLHINTGVTPDETNTPPRIQPDCGPTQPYSDNVIHEVDEEENESPDYKKHQHRSPYQQHFFIQPSPNFEQEFEHETENPNLVHDYSEESNNDAEDKSVGDLEDDLSQEEQPFEHITFFKPLQQISNITMIPEELKESDHQSFDCTEGSKRVE